MTLASPPKTAAHVIGAALAAAGVDTVFGLMGSGNLVVTNALVAGGARFHAARHEGGATAMADGWSRVAGRGGGGRGAAAGPAAGPRGRAGVAAAAAPRRPPPTTPPPARGGAARPPTPLLV